MPSTIADCNNHEVGVRVTISGTATDEFSTFARCSAPTSIAVPNVTGQTQAAATSAITGAGLTVGTVTQQSSSTVASGSVISQSPAAGTNVASGSAVTSSSQAALEVAAAAAVVAAAVAPWASSSFPACSLCSPRDAGAGRFASRQARKQLQTSDQSQPDAVGVWPGRAHPPRRYIG